MTTTTTTKPTTPHRTEAQMRALERRIVAAINREEVLKVLADNAGVSKSHAYAIAQRLGYKMMLLGVTEREAVRKLRGTAGKFKA